MLTPNGLDRIHLSLANGLIKDEIKIEEYIKQRGLSTRVILSEVKYLVGNPIKFNLFLFQLPIGGRCIVMKEVLLLNNRQVAENADFSKTTIGDFIKENLSHNKSSNISHNRNFSVSLFCELAIIFDIPFKYLAYDNIVYKMNNAFDEYETTVITNITFTELINKTFSISENHLPSQKIKIFGAKVVNDFFENENKYLYTRIDIRENWFTIELHILNQSSINYNDIYKLKNFIGSDIKIYIRDAFLRENKKIIILFSQHDLKGALSNMFHLDKDFL